MIIFQRNIAKDFLCKQLLGYEIPSTYELNYGLKMKKFYDTRYYV